MDCSLVGVRCRILWFTRTEKGNLSPGAQGTIRYEVDNLGRRIVCVDWDAGFTAVVFPHEISLEGGEYDQHDVA